MFFFFYVNKFLCSSIAFKQRLNNICRITAVAANCWPLLDDHIYNLEWSLLAFILVLSLWLNRHDITAQNFPAYNNFIEKKETKSAVNSKTKVGRKASKKLEMFLKKKTNTVMSQIHFLIIMVTIPCFSLFLLLLMLILMMTVTMMMVLVLFCNNIFVNAFPKLGMRFQITLKKIISKQLFYPFCWLILTTIRGNNFVCFFFCFIFG